MVDFDRREVQAQGKQEKDTKNTLLGIFKSEELFGGLHGDSPSFVWGAHDKLYRLQERRVDIVEYHPFEYPEELKSLAEDKSEAVKFLSISELREAGMKDCFVTKGTLDISKRIINKEVVRADTAPFGVVIEFDDGLSIIDSTNKHYWLPGEPVNWRVFPKSQDYVNQLHVIYEDRLVIHSFTQDYFVDQKDKLVGQHPESAAA